MRPITVLLVDDMPEVRRGLRDLLPLAGSAAGVKLEIVGEASNGHEAVEQTVALHPDVVLMDLEMPEVDGYSATRNIKTCRPCTRVIALTVHGDSNARRQALEAGADEFVEKGASIVVLVGAIRGNSSEAPKEA